MEIVLHDQAVLWRLSMKVSRINGSDMGAVTKRKVGRKVRFGGHRGIRANGMHWPPRLQDRVKHLCCCEIYQLRSAVHRGRFSVEWRFVDLNATSTNLVWPERPGRLFHALLSGSQSGKG